MLRLAFRTNVHELQLSNKLSRVNYHHGLLRFSQLRPFRLSTHAHFSTDDRSLSGDGIPNFKARIPDLVTETKDIKTDLKDIKTEVKKMVYVFQTIQKEMALQTSQRQQVIDFVSDCAIGVFLGLMFFMLCIGGLWIFMYYADKKWREHNV